MKRNDQILIALSIKIIGIVLVSAIIGFFFVTDLLIYLKGLLLGTIFTLLKLKLMENSFSKAVLRAPHKANMYVKLHYFIRYTLTLLLLIVAVLEPSISLVGVVIALASMKVAAYWQGISESPTPKDGSVEFVEWEDDEEPSDF